MSTNMAGRGTDILLGGSSVGIARVLAKHMLLVKLGITENPPKVNGTADLSKEEETEATAESKAEEDEQVDEETDPDVLALPDVLDLANVLSIQLPKKLKMQTELDLKRAIVSCSDLLSDSAGRLEVEDIVSQAADSAPVTNSAVKLLRGAIKKMTQEFDQVIKLERERVRKLGGLYVVATSKHESRRIDNQLRGRAGRQGDPGATRFFLSLEDDLFKIFGADKLAGMMDNFRVAEDMPIESDLVTQALDKVQMQVEDYFRATRQQVFRLDEVAASQRSAVYAQRRQFLTSSDEGICLLIDVV